VTQIAEVKTHIWPANIPLLVLPLDCDRAIVAFDTSSLRVGDCGVHVAFRKRRGRPKQYANATERKRASRANKERLAEIAEIEREQKKDHEAQEKGTVTPTFIPDAPHGKGLVKTGGYDPEHTAEVSDMQEANGKTRDDLVIEAGGSGHKKHNEGHGPAGVGDEENNPNEEMEFVSSKDWIKIFDNRRPLRLSRSNIHFFCPRHSLVKANAPFAFQDPETGAWVRTFFARLKAHVWEMECGCTRPGPTGKNKNIVTPAIEPEGNENET
jgi:hypothetical protein